MHYPEAVSLAQTIRPTIQDLANNAVTVVHEEGTVLHFNFALAYWLDDQWVAIVTEHHGVHVYDKGDALVYAWSSSSLRLLPTT